VHQEFRLPPKTRAAAPNRETNGPVADGEGEPSTDSFMNQICESVAFETIPPHSVPERQGVGTARQLTQWGQVRIVA